jgi:plasmid stabilization system protein ParE
VPVIVLQPRAKADLSDIWQFIAEDSDDQADALIDLIDQKFQLLAQQRAGSGDDGTSLPKACVASRWAA